MIRQILQSSPTWELEGIVQDLETVGNDILGWYGRDWRKERLHLVRGILRQREWARKEWNCE